LTDAGEHDAEVVGGGSSFGSRACGVIGCLLAIALLVGLGVSAFALGNALEPLADRFLWAPHDVVREYLDAYENGNAERAQRFLCPGTRLLDPSAPVDGGDVWTRGAIDAFPYPRPGGRIGIYYELRLPIRTARAQALIERHDDGWRICALE
jgi:hypothetical protein